MDVKLEFDVKGATFADMVAAADRVVADFIGELPLNESERQYLDVKGINLDVSTGRGPNMLNGGFTATVIATINT